jgi:hypothetical protein
MSLHASPAHKLPVATSPQTIAFLPYLLFFLTPLALLGTLALYAISLESDFRRTQASRALEKELSDILQEADPVLFYRNWFRSLHANLLKPTRSPVDITRALRKANPRNALAFECYSFDKKGNPANYHELPHRELEDVRRLNWILRGQGMKATTEERNLVSRAFLGLSFPRGGPKSSGGEIFPTLTTKGDGLITLFSSSTPNGLDGAIFMIRKKPTIVEILRSLPFYQRGAQFTSPTFLVAVDAHGSVHQIRFPGRNPSKASAQKIPRTFWKTPSQQPFVTQVVKHAGEFSFYALRLTPETDLSATHAAMIRVFIGLVLLVFLAFPAVSSFAAQRFLSIRLKIPLLFLYAILIPMAGAALLGHQTLRDSRERMTTEIHQEAIEILSHLDSTFTREKDRTLRFFRRIRDDIGKIADFGVFADQAMKLRKAGEISLLEIRDARGRFLASTMEQGLKERLAPMLNAWAKTCIKRYLAGSLPPGKDLDLTVAETFLLDFFLSPTTGWPGILERPDELHVMKFADWDILFYWTPLPGLPQGAAYLTCQQRIYFLLDRYLENTLSQPQIARQGLFTIQSWQERNHRTLPRNALSSKQLEHFYQRIRIAQEPVSEEISVGSTTYFATGIPGKQLEGNSLVALYPKAEIDRKVALLTRWFAFGTLGVLLLAMLIGKTLTDSFLRPIRELTIGVDALRKRDVSQQVKIFSRDELGDLAYTFNQTIAGLEELMLAHEVQALLIPRAAPAIPGFLADLMCLPAHDLGGDYCDIQPLPDGQFLVVIGDATGHGVSSALVMTMAKAGVLDFVDRELPLIELLKRLNLVFFTHFQREVVMTFFAAILHPGTGRLQYAGAGHPGPILARANGSLERIPIAHPPLGFSPRTERLEAKEIFLHEEDMLLLFTDLLIEMPDAQGKPWGPRNLQTFVRERRHYTPQKFQEELFNFARHYVVTDSFEDDFTMIVLKRTRANDSPTPVSGTTAAS